MFQPSGHTKNIRELGHTKSFFNETTGTALYSKYLKQLLWKFVKTRSNIFLESHTIEPKPKTLGFATLHATSMKTCSVDTQTVGRFGIWIHKCFFQNKLSRPISAVI